MNLVETERADGYAVLRLNDPDRRNIISLQLVDAIEAALEAVEGDAAVKALIITGNGTAFCAGADLTDLEAARDGDTAGLKRIYDGFLRVAESPLPTIAAVNGPAVGAGMNLALACDLRIAGRSARFDTRFLDLALHPGGGHTWMLNRAAGWQASVAMLLLGQVLDGEEAARHGLVWRCVEDDRLLEAAKALAARAGGYPEELLRRSKLNLTASAADSSHAGAVSREYEDQVWSLGQPEFGEFLERIRARMRGGKK